MLLVPIVTSQDFVSNINARTNVVIKTVHPVKTQGDVTLTFIECLQRRTNTG